MRPRLWFTRRALVCALALLGLFALGSVWFPFAAFAVAAALAFAGLLAADAAALARADVAVERTVSDRFVLGTPSMLRYAVRNRSRVTIDVTVVESPVRVLNLGSGEGAVRVAPGAADEAAIRVVPFERGDVTLGLFGVRFTTPLGLVARTRDIAAATPLRVWPDLHLVRHGVLSQPRRTLEAGLHRLRLRGIGSDFDSLRDYATGDAHRDVAWAATARRGKPIVVTRTVERSQDVLLALDAGRLMFARVGPQRKFDHALAAALTLAGVAAELGDRVGALAFSGTILDDILPRSGRAHAAAMMQRLHALQPRFEESDYERAFTWIERRSTKRSLIVAFTDMFDPVASAALLANLGRLGRRHATVAVLLSDDAVRTALDHPPSTSEGAYSAAVASSLDDERRRAILALGRAGVSVVDVAADAMDLALVDRYVELKSRGTL